MDEISTVEHVQKVKRLHVWSLNSELLVASVTVTLDQRCLEYGSSTVLGVVKEVKRVLEAHSVVQELSCVEVDAADGPIGGGSASSSAGAAVSREKAPYRDVFEQRPSVTGSINFGADSSGDDAHDEDHPPL